jgi:hypothetical protein
MIVKLEKAKQSDPNIGITYSVTMAVDFLHVGIENHRISQTSWPSHVFYRSHQIILEVISGILFMVI